MSNKSHRKAAYSFYMEQERCREDGILTPSLILTLSEIATARTDISKVLEGFCSYEDILAERQTRRS